MIPISDQTISPVDETDKTENIEPIDDSDKDGDSNKTDIPTDDIQTDFDHTQVWPFAVMVVVLAANIVVIVAIRRRKKAIPADGGIEDAGRNNFVRLSKGLNPIDSSGNTFQWHHIGQNNDAALALLTATEHDAGALHGFKVVSEIDRTAFDAYKKILNKDLLKWLLNSAV